MSPAPASSLSTECWEQPCVKQETTLESPSATTPSPLLDSASPRASSTRQASPESGAFTLDWSGLVEKRSVLPPAAVCEAAGLEVAVRAWWHGASGRRRRSSGHEDAWIRTVAAGGLAGGAKVRLLRSGIPDVVLEGGLQLAKVLEQDAEARQIWNRIQQDEAEFVACTVEKLFGRFAIRAAVPFCVEDSCLVLTPRPHSPDVPDGCASRGTSSPQNGTRQGPPRTIKADPPPWVPPTSLTRAPWSEAEDAERWKLQRHAELVEHRPERRPLHSARAISSPDPCAERVGSPPVGAAWPERPGKTPRRRICSARNRRIGAAKDVERRPRSAATPQLPSGKSHQGVESSSFGSCRGSPTIDAPAFPRQTSGNEQQTLQHRSGDEPSKAPKTSRMQASLRSSRRVEEHSEETAKTNFAEEANKRMSVCRRPSGGSKRFSLSNFDKWMKSVQKTRQQEREDYEVSVIQKDDAKKLKCEMANLSLHTLGKKNSARKKVERDISEVRRIFNFFDADHSGTIEPQEFIPLVSRLTKLPKSELNMTEVWRSWESVDTDNDGYITFDEFQTWYCTTFDLGNPDFTNFFHQGLVSPDSQTIREVAIKLGISSVDVENIYTEFKKLDHNEDGRLQFDEFKALLVTQFKNNTKYSARMSGSEVPPSMISKFWKELENGSGYCNFEAFASWYVTYFHSEISPMEHYYQGLGRSFRSTLRNSFNEP